MKRSRAVNLVLLASAAAALEGCRQQQCVDENRVVVDDRYCQGLLSPGAHGYRWYSGGSGSAPMGSVASPAGTTRGVFGAAGESAHGGGGGEGAGE